MIVYRERSSLEQNLTISAGGYPDEPTDWYDMLEDVRYQNGARWLN